MKLGVSVQGYNWIIFPAASRIGTAKLICTIATNVPNFVGAGDVEGIEVLSGSGGELLERLEGLLLIFLSSISFGLEVEDEVTHRNDCISRDYFVVLQGIYAKDSIC